MIKWSVSIPLLCTDPTGSELEDESPSEISVWGCIERRICGFIVGLSYLYVCIYIYSVFINLCICVSTMPALVMVVLSQVK